MSSDSAITRKQAKTGVISMLSVDKAPKSFVYFIASYELRMVKIGYTKDVGKRFRFIEQASPVRLFVPLVVEGCKKKEKELHQRFSKYHSHREWYHMKGELDQFIRQGMNENERRVKKGEAPCDCSFCFTCDAYTTKNHGVPILKYRRMKNV